ncbi:MAG: ROK family protein, partial [Bacteroidales bacterium]|nr:ROK family protein [Bacteroidales bacterium]
FIVLCDIIAAFIEEADAYKSGIACINVNISGRVNSAKGASYSIFKFENNDAPLAEIFHQRLGIPTFIENDTRAMAYSELMLGAGKKYKDFLYINASWGLGLSIIANGQIYRGRDGYSGELGHVHAYDNNIICHCGKKGCMETEISGKALCRKLSERLEKGENSILSIVHSGHIVRSETDIVNAALKEDPVAIELIEETGMKLGLQLANLINIFNPQAILIGGTLAKAGEYFLSPIELAIKRYSLRRVYQGVHIKLTTIENPGVTGACLLALNRYLEKV